MPGGALVPDKGTYPVSRGTITQHRVVVLACRDDVVFFVDDGREVEMRYRAGVAVAGEGHHLDGFYEMK